MDSFAFGSFVHSVKFKSNDSVHRCLNALLIALTDQEFPVKTSAAASLQYFIEGQPARTVDPIIIPRLPDIISAYFAMISDVSVTELVHALQR